MAFAPNRRAASTLLVRCRADAAVDHGRPGRVEDGDARILRRQRGQQPFHDRPGARGVDIDARAAAITIISFQQSAHSIQ